MKPHNHHHHHPRASAVTPTPAPTTNLNQTGITGTPSRDEVAVKAYLIYMKKGCPQGHDVQHWLEAEAQTFATAEPSLSTS